MANPSLRIALGDVSLSLEDASSLGDIKLVLSDLITVLDENLCGEDEEEDHG